jgi:glutaredoxin-related protein
MQTTAKLYGTEFCHLCEEAKAIISAMGIETDYIDIAEDDELSEKYGMRIPVLQRMDTGAELGWPFDAACVLRFLGRE